MVGLQCGLGYYNFELNMGYHLAHNFGSRQYAKFIAYKNIEHPAIPRLLRGNYQVTLIADVTSI